MKAILSDFSSPRSVVAAFVVASLAACIPGAGPSGGGPKDPRAAGASEGPAPFGVVFGAPSGATTAPSEITLVMNRPMRALELAGEETASPATLQPAVPGRWQWVGTSGLLFVPEKRLPRGTSFRVEVPAGTKALDGSTLAEAYRLDFSTARPAVVEVSPKAGKRLFDGKQTFTVRFNQPVAVAEAARAISLMAGGKAVEFDVRRSDPQEEAEIEVVPRRELPRASAIEIRIDKSLRGVEGPLDAGREASYKYSTVGPLAVMRGGCGYDMKTRCPADEGTFAVMFTSPVEAKDVLSAFQVEPPLALEAYSFEEDQGYIVLLRGRFSPSTKYRMRVRAGLKDQVGQALAADWVQTIETEPRPPAARIATEGSVFEPGARRDIPVSSVNVKELKIALAPLSEQAVLDLYGAGSDGWAARVDSLPESVFAGLAGVKMSRVKPGGALDQPFAHPAPIADLLDPKTGRGVLAMGVAYTPRAKSDQDFDSEVLQVTDLAISAKVSRYGSLVRVTRLKDVSPVAGAAVSIRRPGSAGKAEIFRTDAGGFATIPPEKFTPNRYQFEEQAILFARSGDDWTFWPVADGVDVGGAWASLDAPAPFGLTFSDRPIYRPGEVVHIKGMLRGEGRAGQHKGLRTPVGEKVTITVKRPSAGEPLVTRIATLSRFGTFSFDMKIPDDGELGQYRIDAEAGGESVDAPGVFEVAEYRPNDFRVRAEADRSSYVRGDRVRCAVRGEYFSGAPVGGVEARIRLTRAPVSFTPPGLQGFVVDDEVYGELRSSRVSREPVERTDTKLDRSGRAEVSATLAMPGQRGPEEITCEAEVMDAARQRIAGRVKTRVDPAEVYVAVNPGQELFVQAKKPVAPEILVVDPKGARVAGVPVRVELLQRTYKARSSGIRVSREERVEDRAVAACSVVSGTAPVSCSLAVEGTGSYIVRATAADRRGNTAAASARIFALGEGQPRWDRDDPMEVELVPDKAMYEVGETARLLVKSPFPSAKAIVTVERAGIYTRQEVSVTGLSPILKVPITDDLWPNAFVSVQLLRGSGQASAAPGSSEGGAASVLRAGYAMLTLQPDSRRLDVRVKPRVAQVAPGADVDVDIEVHDRAGKPVRAEVTLTAVDEGVLALSAEKGPDPVAIFSAPRPLGVLTVESREGFARVLDAHSALFGEGQIRMGATSVSGRERIDFRTTAYYNPSLLTDARGRARATFKLPDGLTSYRLTAVAAAEDDRTGRGESAVVASLPLMARPAMPRFLRAGDTVEAGVVITSKRPGRSTIEVEASAEGLKALGELRRSIELGANESAEVRFPFEAPKVSTATVRFSAKAGGDADAVVVTREVRAPAALEAAALYGQTRASTEEKLGELAGIREDVGGLELRLSSSALVGLDGGVAQILDYPYGCTEQLASRLLPMLPLRDLARTYGISLPSDVDSVVRATIAKILANQQVTGGFGLWPGSPDANRWVTAYALWALIEARQHGARVPEKAIEEAVRYLKGALDGTEWDDADVAASAFIADVLARAEVASGKRVSEPIQKKIKALFAGREKLPLFARAILAHAMVTAGHERGAVERIAAEIEGSLRLDGPVARAVTGTGAGTGAGTGTGTGAGTGAGAGAGTGASARYVDLLDSDTRTSALVLRALLAVRPSHPLGSKLAMGLLADRRGGEWRTTQEAAWALIALDLYRRAQEPASPDFTARVTLRGTEALRAPFKGPSATEAKATVPISALGGPAAAALGFHVDGEGSLFYEARLRYARKQMPAQALDRGFFVKKTLRAVSPDGLREALAVVPESTQAAFRGGDLVLADVIVVTSSPRRFVVVEDPLPAGLEPVDTGLASTSEWLADAMAGRGHAAGAEDAVRGSYSRAWAREELRDDRALFFLDRMPAGMYRFRYLARATSPGSFLLPPSRAEEMYAPEVFGRSGASIVRVTAR